jgi:hypothetical protein
MSLTNMFVQMEPFVSFWKELPTEFKDNVILSSKREAILNRLELEGLSLKDKALRLRDEPTSGRGKRDPIDRIRARLLYVALYRKRQELYGRIREGGHRRNLNKHSRELAQAVRESGLITDSADDIRTHLATWIHRGARYDALASELGGLGTLVLLPEDISDTMYVNTRIMDFSFT